MPDERDYVERTSDTPIGREQVRETAPATVRSNSAGWWIAAVVAIVAVAGLAFLFTSQNRQSELQAAREQGAAQASVEAAAAGAQVAATQASQAAQSAVDSTARASQRAAEAAQTAANRTAANQAAQDASDASRDASTVEPAPQQ